MNTYYIAVCGTPQVGKRTLLNGIADLNEFEVRGRYHETEPNLFVRGQYQSNTLMFATGSGTYLYLDKMIETLLRPVSAVIYVLSPAYPSNGRPGVSDGEHRRCLDSYLHYAQRFNVGWDQVPWLLVLNQTDRAENLPIEADLFPDKVRQNYVRCIAADGVGVPEVWQKLLELLDLPAPENHPSN